MAEFPVHGDAVVISSPDASALDVPLGDEVGDDRLGRPLGDAHPGGDVPAADLWIGGDADEDVSVIGEERPTGLGGRDVSILHLHKRSRLREAQYTPSS